MNKYLLIENPSRDLWKSLLNRVSDGNFEQSFEYGEVAKAVFPRIRVVRFIAMDNGEPLGIVQGTYSRYFGFGICIRVTNGPVANMKSEECCEVIKSLLTELENYGAKNRIMSAQIWWPKNWGMTETFNALGYTLTRKINRYVVNIEKTVDELWKSIDHNKRRNIKKAMDKGVEVVQAPNYEGLLSFYQMLQASAKRHSFAIDSLSWFETLSKVYKQGELSRVFLVKWMGKDIAGVFIVIHGKTVYALAAGSLSEEWEVRPNDLLHWKVMEWACKQNFSKYYMGFVREPVPTEGSKDWGIWRWKKEWKGNLESILVFDKIYLPRYKYLLKLRDYLKGSIGKENCDNG
jgi:hypothetical protein